MTFAGLETADIYRDGGSYAATLRTADGVEYQLCLRRSRMPDSDGLHHRWLFAYEGAAYRGPGYPPHCVPIVTGSDAEHELLDSLRIFIEGGRRTASEYHWRRFNEMFHYIALREPSCPSDLRAAGFLA
jgi:hypothetical protein